MVLDISKEVEDVDKVEEEEKYIDLKRDVEAASISQPVDRMKQINDGEKYEFLPILDEKKERYEDH